MQFATIARLLICVYLPLAWLDRAVAISRYSTFAEMAALGMFSIVGTLALAASFWLVLYVSLRIVKLVLPRADFQRLANTLITLAATFTLSLVVAAWSAGWGFALPRRLVTPIFMIAALFFCVRQHQATSRLLQKMVANAWSLTRVPLACVLVVGLGAIAFSAVSVDSRDAPRAQSNLSAATRPSILLITIDSFSARRASLYGAPESTTPNLDRFARDSVTFEMAIAASNFTAPTTASVHTGLYPWSHGIYGQQTHFVSPPTTLASTLAEAGYRTASFDANWWADPRHARATGGWSKMRGPYQAVPNIRWRSLCSLAVCDTARLAAAPPFAELRSAYEFSIRRLGMLEAVHYPPDPLFADARNWIAHQSSSNTPLFVWVHVLAPHDPYFPPPRFLHSIQPARTLDTVEQLMQQPLYSFSTTPVATVQILEGRYKENLRYVDECLGRFLSDPAVAALTRNGITVITADHGESFERGFLGHTGPLLTQSLIRIPLVVHAPGFEASRISTAVSQVDLFPTLLAFAGADRPAATTDGRSLVGLMRGESAAPRTLYSMNLELSAPGRSLVDQPWSVSALEWPWKLVAYQRRGDLTNELYNLATDPDEQKNLVSAEPSIAHTLVQRIRAELRQ